MFLAQLAIYSVHFYTAMSKDNHDGFCFGGYVRRGGEVGLSIRGGRDRICAQAIFSST